MTISKWISHFHSRAFLVECEVANNMRFAFTWPYINWVEIKTIGYICRFSAAAIVVCCCWLHSIDNLFRGLTTPTNKHNVKDHSEQINYGLWWRVSAIFLCVLHPSLNRLKHTQAWPTSVCWTTDIHAQFV